MNILLEDVTLCVMEILLLIKKKTPSHCCISVELLKDRMTDLLVGDKVLHAVLQTSASNSGPTLGGLNDLPRETPPGETSLISLETRTGSNETPQIVTAKHRKRSDFWTSPGDELLSHTQLNGIVLLWLSRALNLFIPHQEIIHDFPPHHGGRTDGAASWQRFSCTMCTGSVHEQRTLRRLTFHKSQLIACDMHVVFHEEMKRKDVRGRRSQILSSNFHTSSSKVCVCSSLISAAKWQIYSERTGEHFKR